MIHRVVVGFICVALATGCRGETQPGPAPAGSAAAAAAAAGSGKGASAGSAKPPPEDPKVREAYRLGMRKGRKATGAKRYKEAIAGFDEALAAKPNDSRALGERGFARLLEGSDLEAATRDFDLAAGGTKDPQLLSEIWFNRGLVEEKRGNGANAIAAFVIANTLRPSKAAQAKIPGKTTCPVIATRLRNEATDAKPAAGEGWLGLANALRHPEDAEPKTAAEAIQMLTNEDQEPAVPALIVAGDYAWRHAYVVSKRGVSLHAQPIGAAMGGRCAGSVSGSIVKADATWIHARVTEEMSGGYTYMCLGKDDELMECTDKEGEVSAGTACRGGSSTVRDVVIERASGDVVLVLEQPGRTIAEVELAADGLKLSGLGCDRTVPFASK